MVYRSERFNSVGNISGNERKDKNISDAGACSLYYWEGNMGYNTIWMHFVIHTYTAPIFGKHDSVIIAVHDWFQKFLSLW